MPNIGNDKLAKNIETAIWDCQEIAIASICKVVLLEYLVL